MITAALFSFLASIVTAVLGVLPTIAVPSWLNSSDSAFTTVFQYADSMSVWFPTSLVVTVLAAWLAIKLAAFGLYIARLVVSMLTGGGGT